MSQWNMAGISIGCILIIVSNQMEKGLGLMLTGVIIVAIGIAKFMIDLKKEKAKNKSPKVEEKSNKKK